MPEVQNLSADEVQKLVHEFHTHQIALEMQNDELRRIQWDLEESRTRYAELYDYAPVGYFTLDQNSRITEVNLTGAAMFGLERSQIIGYPFISFVHAESANTFFVHTRKARETHTLQACELKLHHPRVDEFDARLETVAFSPHGDGPLAYRITVSDICERKRAEIATGYLAEIVKSSDDAIVSKDLNGVITSWNRGAQNLFGYSPEEVIGKLVTLLIPPDHLDEEPKILERIRRGEPVLHYETVRRRKDGNLIDISLTVSPIRDADGRVIGAAKIARDITDRKEAEAARLSINNQLIRELTATQRLQKMSARLIQGGDIEDLYKHIVDTAMDIMHSDMSTMQIIDNEKAALRMLTYRGFDSAFSKAYEWVDGETKTACGMALHTGRRVIVPDVETFGGIAGTPSCAAHLALGIRAAQSTPLFSRAGQILGMISTLWRMPYEPSERDLQKLDILARQAADLMERTQSADALRESEQRLKLAVQRAPLLLYHQCPSLTYTWMLEPYPGLMMEQIIGKTDGDIFPADEALPLTVLKQQVIDTGAGVREVVQHTLRDQVYFYDLSIEPIKNAAGKVVALTCAAVDVTARRRDEEIIKQHNEEMEDFLYIIAHDLKSPVVSLQGLLGMMRDEKASALDPEGVKMLDFCIEECTRMKNIVLQVREMGRIKQTSVVQEKANLQSFIHSVVQRFDKEIKAKKVRMTVDCPDVEVTFAKVQVDQALNNLIDNALKYGSSSPASMLTIQGQVERTVSRIRVIDNGLGIAPVHHQQVFKLFRRLDPKGPVPGTGVGLTSVQSLMRRIKGEVNLKSDVNQATQLTISFPSQIAK